MKAKLQTLLAKVKRIYQIVKWFFIDCFGWCRSKSILFFCGIKRMRMFYGYGHYIAAYTFAEKRARKWKRKWDQKGKCQAVFAYGGTKLIVFSELEAKILLKRKILKSNINYRKLMSRASYYKTALNYKPKK